ncbi:zinc finger CCCH domain-containing protein 2 [Dendrobium catenatum]|uniref:Zinc finger CCCH domain-containing protein 20 n=1 Tax=Dendrobium catenatum TaxID=906689 RepID=A0A2I0XCM4_9ASPA|nr:zinc finger CCCH domain-containing protein 2 [Dendrobium catenatum]PKU85660.1 Zinc finger CCCH domain-containing protein 20 [Dendrobium catenatum]
MKVGHRTGCHPTVHVPPWTTVEESDVLVRPYPMPVSGIAFSGGDGELSPYTLRELTLFMKHRFLPSNDSNSNESDLADPPLGSYSSDFFRMYEFKVKRCARGRSHDWTECPFAHPGEKARRRDPMKFQYSGTSCPDFRKGNCKKGDACEYAHGVFECWLHPTKYRTQSCKDGTACRRRVCFFAHTPEQLRLTTSQQPSPKSDMDNMVSSIQNMQLGKRVETKKEAVKDDGRVSPDFGWVWDLVK